MDIPVGPVQPDRRTPRLVSLVVVAALVGAFAFAAGLWLGHGTTIATASPTPAPSPVAVATATPSPPAQVNWPSDFARRFDPLALIAAVPDGDSCHGGLAGENWNGGGGGIPGLGPTPSVADYWYSKAWVLLCAVPPSDPIWFVGNALEAIASAVPSSGWGSTRSDQGDIAQIPYRQSVFTGLVTVGAFTMPGGVEVSVTLVERPTP